MNEDEEFLPGGFAELLRQAQEMQEELLGAQDAAPDQMVEGRSGGGAVRLGVSGAMEFLSVHIDPEVVDPDDVALLEDLVLAALHDATDKVAELNRGLMGGLGSLGGALGGLTGGANLTDMMDALGPMLSGMLGAGPAGAGGAEPAAPTPDETDTKGPPA